jgi:hypothetical protein
MRLVDKNLSINANVQITIGLEIDRYEDYKGARQERNHQCLQGVLHLQLTQTPGPKSQHCILNI